ncbi:hypothetical protein FQZ97_934530 [compost metagenome]
MGQAREDARRHQRFVGGRQPGQQVAGGEQRHQRQQQALARQAAGQRREHRRTDGNAQRVEADQQAGGGQTDGQVRRHRGQQADDHELGRADGECAERQREQGNGHGTTPEDEELESGRN